MSKAEKELQRMQEKFAKKYNKPKENPLRYLTYGWVFEKWYEKLFLVVIVYLAGWKVLEVIF